ncbi:MAG: hypothetical protein PHD95_05920 [Candidatus ainarchaeum sp.]|nr:hypothetical protein [Candidatus ainarchaeum sp.]
MPKPRKRLASLQYLGPERRKEQVGHQIMRNVFILQPHDFPRINFAKRPGTYIITLKNGKMRVLEVYKKGNARISEPADNLQKPKIKISVEKFFSDPDETAQILDLAYRTKRIPTRLSRPSEN